MNEDKLIEEMRIMHKERMDELVSIKLAILDVRSAVSGLNDNLHYALDKITDKIGK